MGKKTKQTKKVTPPDEKHIWVIAYINREKLEIVEEELRRYEYKLETYIPTVRVIKKKFKGKNMFEFVPMLFNYGFFKISYTNACNPEYLMELRTRISCIYGWVKDPANSLKDNIRLRKDNKDSYQALPGAAFASDEDIARMVKVSGEVNIYSADELKRFKKGDYIKLKGYPFDDVPAEILEINHNKKEIKVSLLLDALVKVATVSFENVFYTVYQQNGYDDSLSNDLNMDEMNSHAGKRVDKMMFDTEYYD